tara:strand:+ start:404 stop:910 length:507 start_codon:yes stop_codon:yes gene_type:complete
MKHIHTFENFVNEAAAIRVTFTPDLFRENSVWGIHKNERDTGCSTWRWNSDLLADTDSEIIIGEQNVIMIEVSVWSSGDSIAKVGITNSLKKQPTTTYGQNFTFKAGDVDKDLKGIASEAAKFLMDKEHFKWINKNIKSDNRSLILTPKGDFSSEFEKVIMAAIKDKK